MITDENRHLLSADCQRARPSRHGLAEPQRAILQDTDVLAAGRACPSGDLVARPWLCGALGRRQCATEVV